jgi:hypothetical protein
MKGDRGELVTTPVVQDGVVGEIEDRVGSELLEGLGEQPGGVRTLPDGDPRHLVQPPGRQLLPASRHDGPGKLRPPVPEAPESSLYHRGIVLTIDHDHVSDGSLQRGREGYGNGVGGNRIAPIVQGGVRCSVATAR